MKAARAIRLTVAALVAPALVSATGCTSTADTATSTGDTPAAGAVNATAGTSSSARAKPVCGGIAKCRVVARADVDGDRRADRIGWAAHEARGEVVIRVATADGELLSKRLDVSLWFDVGAWGGARRIDGRRGAEMLVGTQMGAHTPLYTMLTYRGNRLVVEKAPTAGDQWWIDAAYSVFAGWNRDVRDGKVLMRFTLAMRSRDDSFDGYTTTYVWRQAGWHRLHKTSRHWASARRAEPVAGWHVRGLERFPGL
jgi:hypothetical protein